MTLILAAGKGEAPEDRKTLFLERVPTGRLKMTPRGYIRYRIRWSLAWTPDDKECE